MTVLWGLVVAGVLMAQQGAVSAIKWESCATGSSPVTVNDVIMHPDPAVSGSNFTISLPATTGEELDAGSVSTFVTYYGVPVHWSTEDLCLRTPCPVLPGPFAFNNTQFLPSVTPAGKYLLWLSLKATSGSVLFCVRVSFGIEKPSRGRASLMYTTGTPGLTGHRAAL